MTPYHVKTPDGDLGACGTVLFEPGSRQLAGVVLHRREKWGEETIPIPVEAVDRLLDGTIYLNITRRDTVLLPAFLVYG